LGSKVTREADIKAFQNMEYFQMFGRISGLYSIIQLFKNLQVYMSDECTAKALK